MWLRATRFAQIVRWRAKKEWKKNDFFYFLQLQCWIFKHLVLWPHWLLLVNIIHRLPTTRIYYLFRFLSSRVSADFLNWFWWYFVIITFYCLMLKNVCHSIAKLCFACTALDIGSYFQLFIQLFYCSAYFFFFLFVSFPFYCFVWDDEKENLSFKSFLTLHGLISM